MLFPRRYLSMSLKGYWMRMCNLAWKPRNWNIFTLYAAFGCFMNIYTKETLFPLRIWASRGATMLFRSLSVKSRFRTGARDVFDTVFTHSGLVHDVIDTDCWMLNTKRQNSRSCFRFTVVFPFHGCVSCSYVDLEQNRTKNRWKNWRRSTFFFLYSLFRSKQLVAPSVGCPFNSSTYV